MSSVFSLFNILAIIYLFRSVQLGLKIWREWAQIKAEPFTPPKKQLADQSSYFIAVPIGVMAHELGHALAVWAFGGEVVEFGYRGFWGYVVPSGNFTASEDWFIALAGTLASLTFGLFVWLLFRQAPSTTLRYFGLRAFRFQVFFSLIYYPLFTLFGFDGDWRTIYNFGATPLLSTGTATLHAAILVLFWRFDRTGVFEAPSHENMAAQGIFEMLAKEAALSPQDAQLQIQYIDGLRQGGAKRKARHHLDRFLVENPTSATGYLELAALESAGKNQIPKKASESAEKALGLGLADSQQRAFAYELTGRYKLEMGQADAAVNQFSEALANRSKEDRSGSKVLLLRSQALRRQQRYEDAYQDIMAVVSSAQKNDDQATMAMARQELETLENHAGHTFSASQMEHHSK